AVTYGSSHAVIVPRLSPERSRLPVVDDAPRAARARGIRAPAPRPRHGRVPEWPLRLRDPQVHRVVRSAAVAGADLSHGAVVQARRTMGQRAGAVREVSRSRAGRTGGRRMPRTDREAARSAYLRSRVRIIDGPRRVAA